MKGVKKAKLFSDVKQNNPDDKLSVKETMSLSDVIYFNFHNQINHSPHEGSLIFALHTKILEIFNAQQAFIGCSDRVDDRKYL
jgi:hypothetical protein